MEQIFKQIRIYNITIIYGCVSGYILLMQQMKYIPDTVM